MPPRQPWPAVARVSDPVGGQRYPVHRYRVECAGSDGGRRELIREACHRGDSAAVLLCHRTRGTVLLTRQFRLPPLLAGHPDGRIIEVAGGLLDGDDPAVGAEREVVEETGILPASLRRVLTTFMTPCLVTERVHLFVATYAEVDRVGPGGGVVAEAEDIENVELPARTAYAMAERGEIIDGRTLLLLYYAAAHGILELPVRENP